MALQNGGWCSCGDQFSTSGASESKTKTSIHLTLVGHRWEVFFWKLKQFDEIYCPGTLSQRIANAVHYVLMKNYSLQCATVEVLRGPSYQFSRRDKDKSWDVSFGQECNLCPQEGCIPTWSPCHILHLQSRWNPWNPEVSVCFKY